MMGKEKMVGANLKRIGRYSNTFNQSFLYLVFIVFIILTQLGGFILMLSLLGASALKNLYPSISLPNYTIVLPEVEIKLPKPEIPDFIVSFFQEKPVSEPTEMVSTISSPDEQTVPETPTVPVAVRVTHTPFIPTPEPTQTPPPVVVISDLVYAPEDLCSPIKGIELYELKDIISQEYNVPNQFADFGHHGIDFGSYDFRDQYLYGLPIQAIMAGQVAGIVHDRPPLGNVVILETRYDQIPESIRAILDIQPGKSLYHLYAHLMDDPGMKIGDKVACGEEINRLGNSQTVEAHLHLETRIGKSDQTISSMAFYDTSATEEELAEYLWWRTSGEFVPLNPMDIFLNFRYQ